MPIHPPAPSVLALARWLRQHGLDALVITADGEAVPARETRVPSPPTAPAHFAADVPAREAERSLHEVQP